MDRLGGLHQEVLRKIDNRGGRKQGENEEEEGTLEEDDLGSFEGDEENYSAVAPAVRNAILAEFDSVIEKNDMIDAELLQAVIDRLWSVTTEEEKQLLVRQLATENDAEFAGSRTHNESTAESLAEECKDDIANVENAISFLTRRVNELCLKTMPFTVFNGQILLRCEGIVKEAITV
jgi:hypothetical protein